MRNAYEQILTIRVNMSVEGEFMSGNKVTAVSSPLNNETQQRLLLHANVHGSFVVLEDILEIAGLITSATRDAVETLCIAAGIIINLQQSIEVQRVTDLSNLHFGQNRLFGFEVLVRQLKGVVPQSVLGGTQLLNF